MSLDLFGVFLGQHLQDLQPQLEVRFVANTEDVGLDSAERVLHDECVLLVFVFAQNVSETLRGTLRILVFGRDHLGDVADHELAVGV